MKRWNALLIALSLVSLLPGACLSSYAASHTLPESTRVTLSLIQPVVASQAQEGQSISFRVAEDVTAADGTLFLKAGDRARGTVVSLTAPSSAGQAGSVRVQLQQATAQSGTSIPLRGSVSKEGKPKIVTVIVIAALLFPIGLLALLIKGGDAKLLPETRWDAYTDRDVTITTP